MSHDPAAPAWPAPRSKAARSDNVMDVGPTYDPETTSVCFYVNVRGMRVKSFVTRDWLVSHYGPDVPSDERMVETYIAHARTIDGEIARRVAAGRLEPVWLASRFPPAA